MVRFANVKFPLYFTEILDVFGNSHFISKIPKPFTSDENSDERIIGEDEDDVFLNVYKEEYEVNKNIYAEKDTYYIINDFNSIILHAFCFFTVYIFSRSHSKNKVMVWLREEIVFSLLVHF